ncbi:hypothetical protein ACIGNX_13690 [Actinosynnema sp. NPDC053489]|uniref:hypothetical protein n=1 Tax=Actinosynnema sp. NPDC053489 TaxID=3363916 RepID=UPI0037CABEA9
MSRVKPAAYADRWVAAVTLVSVRFTTAADAAGGTHPARPTSLVRPASSGPPEARVSRARVGGVAVNRDAASVV